MSSADASEHQHLPAKVVEQNAAENGAVDVDATDLVRVEVNYGKLQILLKGVLGRLAALEAAQPHAPAQSTADRLDALEKAMKERPAVASDVPGDGAGLADRVKALETRADSMDPRVDQLAADVDDLKKHRGADVAAPSDDTAAKLKALSDAVDQLKADLDKLAKAQEEQALGNKDRSAPTAAPVAQPYDDGDLRRQLQNLQGETAKLNATVTDGVLPTQVEHRADIDALKKALDALRGDHDTLSGEVKPHMAATDKALADAAKTTADLADDVRLLRSDVDGLLTRRIPELERAVPELQKASEELKANLGAVHDTVTKINTDLTDAQREIAALKDELAALKGKIAAHDGMISMLQPQSATDGANAGASMMGFATTVADMVEDLAKLKRQLEEMERRLAATQNTVKAHDDAIAQTSATVAANKTAADRHLGALDDHAKQLDGSVANHADRIDALEKALAALRDAVAKVPTNTGASASAAVAPAVAAPVDLSGIQKDIAKLQAELADLKAQMQQRKEENLALGRETSGLAEQCQKLWDDKAGRDELDRDRGTKAVKAVAPTPAPPSSDDGKLKALRGDLDALAAKVEDLTKQLAKRGGPSDGAASNASVDGLQNKLAEVAASALKDREWTQGQVVEIRAIIEHIHHSKADAALVANKAERDYVENALEKLMREVEQVLNNTNAGLIDTLDKSLGILRDMLDGKASKADVAKLKLSLNGDESGGNGSVPEGLAGFKSYRCLGCNRTVEAMRPRPMGASFASFMNRLPASPAHSGGAGGRPSTSSAPAHPAITQ